MSLIERTVQSSDLSRNPAAVFEAVEQGPVTITRRDGESLVLTMSGQAETEREGLRLAAAVVAASLALSEEPLPERLRDPFPWVEFLNEGDGQAFAVEVVRIARACASVGHFDRLVLTVHAWRATAEAIAGGYTPDDELDWLQAQEPAAQPQRGEAPPETPATARRSRRGGRSTKTGRFVGGSDRS